MKTALIIVDMQYDYCDGGPLPHDNSISIIPTINRIRNDYDHVIFLTKQLQFNHSCFKLYGGVHPSHVVKGTDGQKIHDDLIIKDNDIIITRGSLQKYDSSTGFYDAESIKKETKLKQTLNMHNIDKLYFCGNGIDSSIYSTIIDAVNNNFECYIIEDAITYMDKNEKDKCITYLNNTLHVNFLK